ncbi:hypothetical protein HK102_006899 [Quaeritorhiza haematococci]|nr:hypothetical protein HK102_006899 [Quaeritorhiza haematococci]
MFLTTDFDTAVASCTQPADTTNYSSVTEVEGVKVYKKNVPTRTGLLEFRAVGKLSNLDAQKCFEVYLDNDYRKEWDEYTSHDIKKQEQVGDLETIYWPVRLAWPFSNREYVIQRESRVIEKEDGTYYVILSGTKSDEKGKTPLKDGHVRVTDSRVTVVFWKSSEQPANTNVYVEYIDDPQGNFPAVMINRVITNVAKGFVKGVKNHDLYNSKQSREEGLKELGKVLDDSMSKAFAL